MGTELSLKQALEAIELADIGHSLGSVAQIRAARSGDAVKVEVELGFPADSYRPELVQRVRDVAEREVGTANVSVTVTTKVTAHGVQATLKPLEGVANIIAVASGKGGVGKSTTAVNLALALSREGAAVGILDADIYGPSVPLMLGLVGERPETEDGKTMLPLNAHGLQVMSIGFLIDPDQPMVWRGPMVTSALNQLLRQTRWEGLDYLIVDMPPGTGDIQLTLSQQVPVSGAVIVTTPQDIALADATKGLQMFRKVSIPVLGVVENMSMHICTSCGHEDPIFGAGGGERMARDYDVDILGRLPLAREIREQTDSGTPTVVAEPDGAHTQHYLKTAQRTAATLATLGRDYSHRFPSIVVEDSP